MCAVYIMHITILEMVLVWQTSNKPTVAQHEQTTFSDVVPADNSQSSPE